MPSDIKECSLYSFTLRGQKVKTTPKDITARAAAQAAQTTAVTIDSPFVTKVDKNMGDSSHPTSELWVSGSDHGVYCTLPVFLNVTYGGSKIINGFVCGSATETIKTI